MVRDPRDISFKSEREQAMDLLHSATMRRELELRSKEHGRGKRKAKRSSRSQKNPSPPPPKKLVHALNAYKPKSRHFQHSARRKSGHEARKSREGMNNAKKS